MKCRLWFVAVLTLVILGLGAWVSPYAATANDGEIKGLAAGVPGGSIALSATGNPSAEFQISFGSPSLLFSVVISPTTQVEIEEGSFPITVSNGNTVEVEGSIDPATGKFLVERLKLEDFLELEIHAFIVDVPPSGTGGTLTLPMTPGSSPVSVPFSLVVSGQQFFMTLTPDTLVEGVPPLTLNDGDRVEFEAILRDGELKVQKIKEDN